MVTELNIVRLMLCVTDWSIKLSNAASLFQLHVLTDTVENDDCVVLASIR